MKTCSTRQVVALCLTICMLCSTICPVFAEETANDQTQIIEIDNGKMFIRETNEKLIAIGADSTTHVVSISMKFMTDPNTVYQWMFDDYSDEAFDVNNLSFWEGIIDYAEEKMEEATVVIFTDEEAVADAPMARSSAGADLRADLEDYHGTEHTDKYINTKVMYGKIFHMYEHLYFSISTAGAKSWNNTITIASLIVGVLGLAATGPIMAAVCGVLGVAFTSASMFISAGKLNKYRCEAHYHRYVRLDSGSKYALTDLIVSYTGYEDANLNSSGRASIIPESRSDNYSHSEDYFTSGIFDDAYESYLLARG